MYSRRRTISAARWPVAGLVLLALLAGIGSLRSDEPPAPPLELPPPPASPDAKRGEVSIVQLAENQAPPAVPETVPAASLLPAENSAAEQSTRLEKSMQVDLQRLAKLRNELVDPMSEYRLAEAAFKEIEEQLTAIAAELAAKMASGQPVAELQAESEQLKQSHKLKRARFDLAIQTRKTLQEQVAALEAKQKQDQGALDKLTGNLPAATPLPPETAPTAATMPPVVDPSTSAPAAAPLPATPAPAAEAAKPEEATSPLVAPAAAKPPRKALVEAESHAQQKKEVALAAQRDVQTVTDRIAALDKDIELENKLLIATRQKADLAYQSAQEIETEKEKRRLTNPSDAELAEVRELRREAESRFRAARVEVAQRIDRLHELQTQRAELQHQELAALWQAQEKAAEADHAEAKVTQLKNPFSLHNLLQWMIDHGLKIGVILVVMLVLRWLVSLADQRLVQLMVLRGARGTKQERQDRAKTLVGVFRNALSLAIMIGGVMMICEEIGIAVGPLMGGAAVLGLAIAFGAQNLIRDYFYGFVILLENQYKLNDVLRIGELAGQVEQITLRMTVLRDIEGNVHFVPNGKIDSVTNLTQGWSRAVIEVAVAYHEDADRVMALLLEIAGELRIDPDFRDQIVDAPEMLGVDSLGDSAVTIKFLVKTRPLSRWSVKRELLRRIKRRFDEVGIEIPFPQRVVHHRYDKASQPSDETLPVPTAKHWQRESA